MNEYFSLGCDPEFILSEKQTKNFVSANSVVNDITDSLGTDGNSRIAEIRPDPSTSPFVLVTRIHHILKFNAIKNDAFRQADWHAGSFFPKPENPDSAQDERNLGPSGFPLGGHIHFGFFNQQAILNNYEGFTLFIGKYLGVCSLLMEKYEDAVKRRGQRYMYGGILDFRKQSHGLEYRAPSSWIGSPKISLAILSLAKVCGYEFFHKKLDKIKQEISNGSVLWGVTCQNINKFSPQTRATLLNSFDDLWNDVKNMYLYSDYSSVLSIIPFLVKNNLSWTTKQSMKEAWMCDDIKQAPQQKSPMSSIWLN